MLKNATIAVTNKCNSRCVMCNIWKSKISATELTTRDFIDLFAASYFKSLVDISISGGEPFLRTDIVELIKGIKNQLPNLEYLWVNTNGLLPVRVCDLWDNIYDTTKNEYLCLSLDGAKEVHNKIRGVSAYDSAIQTLKTCRQKFPKLNIVLSTTISPMNANVSNLEHIKSVAEDNGCTYTFRFANNNNTYYHNCASNFELSEKQINDVIKFAEKYKSDDVFIFAQNLFIRTGKIDVMDNCRAGQDFIFIRPDGTIAPCINSERTIKKPEFLTNLGAHETCPCCTECCFYPMLNYVKNNQQR